MDARQAREPKRGCLAVPGGKPCGAKTQPGLPYCSSHVGPLVRLVLDPRFGERGQERPLGLLLELLLVLVGRPRDEVVVCTLDLCERRDEVLVARLGVLEVVLQVAQLGL